MVGVGRVGGAAAAGRARTKPGPGGAGFAVPTEASTGAAALEAAGPVSLAGMIALQEGAADTVQDRAARRHGETMLALLAGLQRAALGEAADANALSRLAGLAATVPQAGAPGLRDAVAAVALRARIELARRSP